MKSFFLKTISPRFRKILFSSGRFVFIAGIALWWIIPWMWSVPEGLSDFTPAGATILDREGKPVAHLPGRDYYRGGWVRRDDLSDDFINATLAAEDKRFFSHGGLDFLALGRAMKSNFSAGRVVSGASTITQQLVKISSPPGRRNVWVKFREFFQARHVEMTIPKDEILNQYFHRLDYGNLREGSVSAARFYFGKTIHELSLAECALLVSLPQSPSRLNPLRHPERALKRRNWVLGQLETEFGYDSGRIARAKAEPMVFHVEKTSSVVAPHLMSRLLHKGVSGEFSTTLDAALQHEVQEIVLDELEKLRGKDVEQAAVLVVDNKSGEIRAWVGSANRSDPAGGLLDGVLIPRSAGSTLKPFVFALAFREGAWPGMVFPDIPTTYRKSDGSEAPRNFDNRYRGPLTVRDALACSQNIPAMRALQFAGGAREFIPYLEEWGFGTITETQDYYGLGLAIGNAEVRLYDLVRAYASLARQGRDTGLTFSNISNDILNETEITPSIPDWTCYMLADILSDSRARADAFGVNSPLTLPFRCAVKTGTSSDFRDNWCVGFTKEFTVGVWLGNFDFRRMRSVSGVSGAGPVFSRVMQAAHRDIIPEWFEVPEDLVKVEIDSRSGKLAGELPVPDEFKRLEWACRYHLPDNASPAEYDEHGRYVLHSLYAEWYESPHNSRRDALALNAGLWTGEEAPRIISPAAGSTLLIDPELPRSGRLVRLKTNLPPGAVWHCLTLPIFSENDRDILELRPGRHVLKVSHPGAGLECETVITVKSL